MARLSFDNLLRGLLACLTLATGLWARTSQANDDLPASDCPRLDDVAAGLGQVLTTKLGDTPGAGIELRDHGTTWDIEVRGRAATYSDPARDCQERARVAIVFAALVLEPLDADRVGINAQPTARQTASPHGARCFSLEIAPLFALATGTTSGNTPLGLGGQARASLSGERLGLALGAETVSFFRLDVGKYGASIVRAAFDVSARMGWQLERLALAAEIGPYLALLRVRGTGLYENSTSTHVDAGARAALLARLRGPRVAPYFGLQAELGARRIDLTVDPSGSIGQMPRLWLGLVLGGAFDL